MFTFNQCSQNGSHLVFVSSRYLSLDFGRKKPQKLEELRNSWMVLSGLDLGLTVLAFSVSLPVI